jgi:hypothetical protein
MSRRALVVVFAAGYALAAAGCSSEPKVELASAETALSQAAAAEAGTYAAQEFEQATSLLEEARVALQAENEKFALFRDFDPVAERLSQARHRAESAVQSATMEKDRIRGETARALMDAEAALATAQAALDSAPKGKGTQADLEALNADLGVVRSALENAKQAMNAGKYFEAGSRISAAKTQANAISSQVEQAVAKRSRRS